MAERGGPEIFATRHRHDVYDPHMCRRLYRAGISQKLAYIIGVSDPTGAVIEHTDLPFNRLPRLIDEVLDLWFGF